MSGTTSTAIVIGAGIGGLTAALALAAKGWDVQVVERAPALGAVGSYVVFGPNALRALDSIPGGIADDFRAMAVGPAPFERPVAIDLLARRLPAGALRLGTEVADVDPDAGGVTLVGRPCVPTLSSRPTACTLRPVTACFPDTRIPNSSASRAGSCSCRATDST
jgi:NADPH-dependent 2,4-dienoyl-CoA reductase/sulfur reductase-like enzyme